jgi:tetratricopeptide (TPR) repeat protein
MILEDERAIQDKLSLIKIESPGSFEALAFLSYLNEQSIPIESLHIYFNDKNKADEIIKILIENDFITILDEQDDFTTFNIHLATQKVVRSMLSEKEGQDVFNKISNTFINFYHKNFATLIDGDREDQIYYSHLSKLSEYIKDDRLLLPLNILYLKRSLYSQKTPEETIKCFVKIERLLKKHEINDIKLLADYLVDCVFIKGFSNAHNLKKFQDGIQDGHKAIQLYESLNNSGGVFKSYTRMAWISLYQGDVEQCSHYLSKVDKNILYSIENYITKEYFFVQSWYNLCIRDYNHSIDYSLKGIEIDQTSKNPYLGLYFWVQLSYAYAQLGQIDEALKTVDEGLDREKALHLNDNLAKAALLYTKALILLYKNNLSEAKEAIEQSLTIFHAKMRETPYQDTALALKILGEIELKLKNYDEAIKALLNARQMFETLSTKNESLDIAECLRLLCLGWKKSENEEQFENTYHSFRKSYGEDHMEMQKLQKELLKEAIG